MKMDFAGMWQSVGQTFASVPLSGYVLALLCVCLAVIVIGEVIQRKAMMQHLQILSAATDEQSRLIERMRRSLSDIMEIVVAIENGSRQRARAEQVAPLPSATSNAPVSAPASAPANTNGSAIAESLRQELESLRAEFEAELPEGTPRD
jgi:hypothetical protein